MDSLIASENVYQIVPEKPDFVDGAFIPYSQQAGDLNWWRSMGHGGTIYFSLTPDFYYPSGFLSTSRSSPATVLAHELMRAVADMKHEPNGPLGSKERKKANNLAVKRANEAYRRLGKPERTSY